MYLNDEGKSAKTKLFCGAPVNRLNKKIQEVDIYWKGKLYKSVTFKEKNAFEFFIDDAPRAEGFLEFRIHPTFNLKKMGISEETRDLGIQLYKTL